MKQKEPLHIYDDHTNVLRVLKSSDTGSLNFLVGPYTSLDMGKLSGTCPVSHESGYLSLKRLRISELLNYIYFRYAYQFDEN